MWLQLYEIQSQPKVIHAIKSHRSGGINAWKRTCEGLLRWHSSVYLIVMLVAQMCSTWESLLSCTLTCTFLYVYYTSIYSKQTELLIFPEAFLILLSDSSISWHLWAWSWAVSTLYDCIWWSDLHLLMHYTLYLFSLLFFFPLTISPVS